MPHLFPTRRKALRFGAAAAVLLLAPRARACEFFAPTLRVIHPWTRATAPGAETAIVCMTFDQVTQDDRLIGVETPVAASARLTGALAGSEVDLAIPQGRETRLAEEGTQLELLGLRHPLEVARSYPLLLTFARGGTVRADLNVDYAGLRFR